MSREGVGAGKRLKAIGEEAIKQIKIVPDVLVIGAGCLGYTMNWALSTVSETESFIDISFRRSRLVI
jgi:hypothetical protein